MIHMSEMELQKLQKQFTFLSLYVTNRRVVTIKEKYHFDVDDDFDPTHQPTTGWAPSHRILCEQGATF